MVDIFKWSDGLPASAFDASAIHDNEAGEINALDSVTPETTDIILLEDASDSYSKKKATITSLPATDTTAIHDNEAGEISAITEKTTLVDNDIFLIEDSEASNAKKKILKSNIIIDGAKVSNYLTETLGVGIGVKRLSSQSISNDSWQAVDWASVVWENLPSGLTSQWSSGTSGRITCRVSGIYTISTSIRFQTNTIGVRGMTIQESGVSEGGVVVGTHSGSLDTQLSHTVTRPLTVGDYIQVLVYQNSGGNLNINYGSNGIILSMAKVG